MMMKSVTIFILVCLVCMASTTADKVSVVDPPIGETHAQIPRWPWWRPTPPNHHPPHHHGHHRAPPRHRLPSPPPPQVSTPPPPTVSKSPPPPTVSLPPPRPVSPPVHKKSPPPPVRKSPRPEPIRSPSKPTDDCSMVLINTQGCVGNLITSFFADKVGISSSCCNVISGISDECFVQAFTQFEDDEFVRRVRDFCA